MGKRRRSRSSSDEDVRERTKTRSSSRHLTKERENPRKKSRVRSRSRERSRSRSKDRRSTAKKSYKSKTTDSKPEKSESKRDRRSKSPRVKSVKEESISKKSEYRKEEKPRVKEPEKEDRDPEKVVTDDHSVRLAEELKTKCMQEEARKKKERIEAWRRRMQEGISIPTVDAGTNNVKIESMNFASVELKPCSKATNETKSGWTLDNDDDEDELEKVDKCENRSELSTKPIELHENQPSKHSLPLLSENKSDNHNTKNSAPMANDDDDIDPLDAYMESLMKESPMNVNSTLDSSKSVKTVVVKKPTSRESRSKCEVIEQNDDQMEYSSEGSDNDISSLLEVAKNLKSKKDLPSLDHSKISYAPFRKDFYIEVPEIAKLTPDEVTAMRATLEGIIVRGKSCPKPVKNWAQTGVSLKVLDVLKKNGYERPTPIQAQAIPAVLSGRDIIGIAKTGSGKTLAFLLPMFRHVMDQPPLEDGDGPIAIIITPTRELALQIYRDCRKFAKPMGLAVVCLYGGSGISDQIAELKRGTEIAVCTPGRMIDMLGANNGKVTNCRRCTYLVIDEADRMFDLGFEPQVMKILEQIRPDRQTIMFSATFPRQMEGLARKILTKPIEIQVGGRSIVCSEVEQYVIVIEEDNKFFKLLELLGVYQEHGQVLVFVEKQDSADMLLKDLLKKGYPCLSLHGGMDQYDRDSTISDFKNAVAPLMIATSVAARGLDVKNLILVVNFDCPSHYEDYVHRCGRTGRAGNQGTAYTFITPDEGKLASDVIMALQLSHAHVPMELQQLWTSHVAKLESEGKTVTKNAGFGGKGFKFDQKEIKMRKEMQTLIKRSLNMQDSDDEAEEEETTLVQIESDIEKAFSGQGPRKTATFSAHALQNVDKDKIEAAQSVLTQLNEKITTAPVAAASGSNALEGMSSTQQAAASILKGETIGEITVTAASLARQLAERLNAKLNYSSNSGTPMTAEQKLIAEQMEFFVEEIDINDFPQQARWRITSRETLTYICEITDTAISVRGQYLTPSARKNLSGPIEMLNPNERGLYLVIESNGEMKIQMAKAEIKRVLKEEMLRIDPAVFRSAMGGRYRVV